MEEKSKVFCVYMNKSLSSDICDFTNLADKSTPNTFPI